MVHLTLRRFTQTGVREAARFAAAVKHFSATEMAVIKMASPYLSQGDMQLSFHDGETYFIIICGGRAGLVHIIGFSCSVTL